MSKFNKNSDSGFELVAPPQVIAKQTSPAENRRGQKENKGKKKRQRREKGQMLKIITNLHNYLSTYISIITEISISQIR